MVSFVCALLLLGFSLFGIALRKIYYYLPSKELKRQAEAGDKLARTLWQAVAYDNSLRVLLWIWIGLSTAGGFVLLAKTAPWPIALVATALLLWVAFAWFPRRAKVSGIEARLSAWITPGIAWLLNYLHPIFDRTLDLLARRYPHDAHTNLYEPDDLVELADRQQKQSDNRISVAQLDMVKRLLSAHKYKLSDVLTPRAQVKTVSDTDTIGLLLLDELHAAGQSSFPVRAGKSDKIIGALYLQDLGLKTEGTVRDFMQRDVRYVHEDDSLQQALQAFFKTKHQLFVVVNSFEEYVGIITLERITQQLMGQLEEDDFDRHADMAAVANKHAYDDEPAPLKESTREPEAPFTEDADFAEVEVKDKPPKPVETPEADEVAVISEPEAEIVTDETSEPATEPEEIQEPEPANPDELAALDLPDEPGEEEQANHITFTKPKKPKSKAPESDDEVIE